MPFVIVGVLAGAAKWLGFAGLEAVAWPWFVLPFAAALAWWAWADASGLTARRAMAALDARRDARRSAQRESLGLRRRR